jgi:phosphoesterase RecJ-like protein
MTNIVQDAAPQILDIIKASKNILLHCHPSPDPDSVGSALAMKFALESLGKKVTVIAGDSAMPEAFMHFPGAKDIVTKNIFEVDFTGTSGSEPFDLFISQDAGSLDMISRKKILVLDEILPASVKTIVIDHHITNTKYAKDYNLVDATYPATAQILYDLFNLWGIQITPEIAANLFIGIFTDTGGLRFSLVTSETYAAEAALVKIYPDFSLLISRMENTKRPQALAFQGLAFSRIETFLLPNGDHLAISSVPYSEILSRGFVTEDIMASLVAGVMRGVIGYDVAICIVEREPNLVKGSMRKRDEKAYDLSTIAAKLGGGGHKAAAGVIIPGTIEDAKKKIIEGFTEYVKMSQ